MKRILTHFFLLACLVSAQQVLAANANVNIADFSFTPSSVTITQGESVTWHWINGTHPTQSDSNPPAWTTFTLGPGNTTFTHVFNTPGTYPYHCLVHGQAMSGTIVVQARTTGMKEDRKNNLFPTVSPNPASGVLKIAFNNTSEKYDLRITNLIGQTVKTISSDEISKYAGKELKLDVADMPNGLYFITLFNKEGILETRRQVIVR